MICPDPSSKKDHRSVRGHASANGLGLTPSHTHGRAPAGPIAHAWGIPPASPGGASRLQGADDRIPDAVVPLPATIARFDAQLDQVAGSASAAGNKRWCPAARGFSISFY